MSELSFSTVISLDVLPTTFFPVLSLSRRPHGKRRRQAAVACSFPDVLLVFSGWTPAETTSHSSS